MDTRLVMTVALKLYEHTCIHIFKNVYIHLQIGHWFYCVYLFEGLIIEMMMTTFWKYYLMGWVNVPYFVNSFLFPLGVTCSLKHPKLPRSSPGFSLWHYLLARSWYLYFWNLFFSLYQSQVLFLDFILKYLIYLYVCISKSWKKYLMNYYFWIMDLHLTSINILS